MIDFSISLGPFLVIGVVNFFVSWLYYSPAVPWFKAWVAGTGVDPEKKEMTDEDKKAMPRLMVGATVATFLLSYVLQVVVHSVKAGDFATGAITGALLWAGFALTVGLNSQFEGKKPVVLVINNVLYLVTYTVYGGVLAVWH